MTSQQFYIRNYRDINIRITEEYSKIKSKYPILYSVLEHYLRQKYTRNHRYLIKVNFRTRLKFIFYRLFLLFKKPSKTLSNESIYLDIKRFEYIKNRILQSTRNTEVNVFGPSSYDYSINLSAFIKGNFFNNFLLSICFKFIDRKNINPPGTINKFLFRYTNNRLILEIQKLVKIINLFNFRKILLQEDYTYHNRLLCIAAKQERIETFLFTHGYVNTNSFDGHLPVIADKCFVWTKEQREYFLEYADAESKKKIFFSGCVHKIIREREVEIQKILFLFPNINYLQSYSKNILEDINVFLEKEIASSFELVMIFHPVDGIKNILSNKLHKYDIEMFSGINDTEINLDKTIVLNFGTSAAIELFFQSSLIFNIKDAKFPGFIEIGQSLSLEALYELLINSKSKKFKISLSQNLSLLDTKILLKNLFI